MSGVKVGGVWKTPASAAVKVGGVWRTVASSSVKVGGAWRTSTLGSAPAPVIAYISTGLFEVTNTASTGVYTPTLITGGGTANVSTVAGKLRYQLTNASARFSLTYSYAAGAPQSAPDFMERKPYAYTCRDVPRTEYYYDQPCYLDAECGGCTSGPGQCGGRSESFGQCGCPGYMCWNYYNGTVCTLYSRTVYDSVCDVLTNEPTYTNGGSEWYKVN